MGRGWLALAMVLTVGCATAAPTVFRATHLHPAYHNQRYTTIVVAPISDSPLLRRTFADAVVQYLSVWTARTASGTDVLPRSLYDADDNGRIDSEGDRDVIRKHLADAGFQAVLTVAMRARDQLPPGASRHWSDEPLSEYFAERYEEAHAASPEGGDGAEAVIETNLYDTSTGQVIWSGRSVTVNPVHAVTLAQSYAAATVGELVRLNLVGKR